MTFYKTFVRVVFIAVVLVFTTGVPHCVKKDEYFFCYKYNRFLPAHCQFYENSFSKQNIQVLKEIKILCQVSPAIYKADFIKELKMTSCHDDLLETSDDLNEGTVLYFVTEEKRGKLAADLELERLFQGKLSAVVSSLVNIRRQLRKLYNAFLATKLYDEEVCLPFFTDEDATITSELASKLVPLGGRLVTYLALDPKKVVLEVEQQILKEKLVSIITKWKIGSPTKQKKAKQELEELLLSHSEKVEYFAWCQSAKELKMSDIVAFQDKRQIYGLLGLNEEQSFDNGERVVAVRNALRELDAVLNGEKVSEPVYLPLFSDEDARIISTLEDRLENVKLVKSENLLEGLRQISELAQQVRKKKFKHELMKQVIGHLNSEYISIDDITDYVYQQLRKFYKKSNPKVLLKKIGDLIECIDQVQNQTSGSL
ncbi:MAG: hypothetical protein ABFS56_05535 [Pseudomonadota bacterium]